MRFAITFVCQPGELEIKSLLLVASLRRHLVGDFSLVACIPRSGSADRALRAATRAAFRSLDIETRWITNTVDASYPIANKVSCFDVAGPAERVLFLDSDILCLRPLVLEEWFTTGLTAKPADLDTFSGDDGMWSSIYTHFDLPPPRQRMEATVSEQTMPPYFNAGVVSVPQGIAFGETWAECCRQIDRLPSVPNKRPHLDQIALPVAMHRLQLQPTLLDERLNFPAHLRPLADDATLCHYHWPTVLAEEPRLTAVVTSLVAEHPLIAELLSEHPSWRVLIGEDG